MQARPIGVDFLVRLRRKKNPSCSFVSLYFFAVLSLLNMKFVKESKKKKKKDEEMFPLEAIPSC